jgi:hypothetical protein
MNPEQVLKLEALKLAQLHAKDAAELLKKAQEIYNWLTAK